MAFGWFETVSSKERKRREDRLRSEMLPFGEAQREAELRLLRALVTTRARDSELLFQLISAKTALRPAKEEDDPDRARQNALREWLHSKLARGYSAQERAVFWALAELEQPAQSLADLPDAEQVRQKADALMAQHAALLR